MTAATLLIQGPVAAASAEGEIQAGLAAIRSAALSEDTSTAAPLLAQEMAMISQSGKLYPRDGALADLGNGFAIWENSEIVIRADRKLAIVTLINQRQRPDMPVARFRVLQTWKKISGHWLLAAQSSVKLAE